MQTQHTNQVQAFLGSNLKLLIESGAVSDQDFCRIATPAFLANKLAAFPEQRANILLVSCGIPVEIGTQLKPDATEQLLSTALRVNETNPDPTQFMPTRIRNAVIFPEWIPILGEKVAWEICLSSLYYLQTDESTQEIVVRQIEIARKNNVLDAETVLSAISPSELGAKLSEALVRKIAIVAMTDALAGQKFSAESIQALTSDQVLVRTFGPEFIVTRVFGAVAKKHGLVEEKIPTVTRSGFTPQPPAVSTEEPSPEPAPAAVSEEMPASPPEPPPAPPIDE